MSQPGFEKPLFLLLFTEVLFMVAGLALYFDGQSSYQKAAQLDPESDFLKEIQPCRILRDNFRCTHKPQMCSVHIDFKHGNSTYHFQDSDWQDKWVHHHIPAFRNSQEVPCWRAVATLSEQRRRDYDCQNAACVRITNPANAVKWWNSEGHRTGDTGVGFLIAGASFPFCVLAARWLGRRRNKNNNAETVQVVAAE
eukprot:TRINITY_DN83643_c0_g1_i1.p1 TRINITY_DN83643_c0_g1~~TRINITY_DN83643_c0_g1_i1.p1  ORF type:complete len:196 (-),score=19.94 TRINITY_DN83643_c0_g1_i1:371-958(-)